MWSDLDAIGEKLGYPIYLFQGGYCANSMVCDKQTAMAVVRKLPRSGKLQVFMVSDDFPQTQFEIMPYAMEDGDDGWNLQKALLQVMNGCKLSDFRLARAFLTEGHSTVVAKYVKTYPYLAANEIACFLRNPNLREKVIKDWIVWHSKHEQTLFEDGKTYLAFNASKIVASLKIELLGWFIQTFLKEFFGTDMFAETEQALLKRCLDLGRVDLINLYLTELEPLNGFYGLCGGDVFEMVQAVAEDNPKVASWYANEYLPRTTVDA